MKLHLLSPFICLEEVFSAVDLFQFWMLSPEGEIRRDEGCIDYAGQFVMIYPCHGMKGNQEWIYGPVRSFYIVVCFH